MLVLQQRPRGDGAGAQDGAADRVRPQKLPEGAAEGRHLLPERQLPPILSILN